MCSDFEPPSIKTSEKGNAEHSVAALLDNWVHFLNYISPFYYKYKTWEYFKTFFVKSCVILFGAADNSPFMKI